MKRLLQFLTIVLALANISCKDKCRDVLCFSPPEKLVFNVVDMSNGENLFYNGTLDSTAIQVVNLDDNSEFGFEYQGAENQGLIVFQNIGWKTETLHLKVSAGGDFLFQLTVEVRRVMGDCCSASVFDKVEVEQADSEYSSSTGIYTVMVQP